jgi:hypothetical protein
MKSDLTQLELAEINAQLKKLTSFKFQFLMGLVRGTAIAIGTTLIAGIILAALAQFVSSAEYLPITNRLLEPFRN